MNKYSDLSDKLTELQVKQNSEIGKLFNEILEDYKNLEKRYNEVEKQCIDYETSNELGIGYEVLQYGKILDVLYDNFDNGKSLENVLKEINNLYNLEMFENSGYVLEEIENKIMKELERNDYDLNDTLMQVIHYIEYNLILDSIMEKAK